MRSLIGISLKKETLLSLPDTNGYIKLTASIEDKLDKYSNNVSVILEQSKEERDAKAKRTFVGNGKVFWTQNGIIKTAKDTPASDGAPAGAREPF
jgi:hypothetical protein